MISPVVTAAGQAPMTKSYWTWPDEHLLLWTSSYGGRSVAQRGFTKAVLAKIKKDGGGTIAGRDGSNGECTPGCAVNWRGGGVLHGHFELCAQRQVASQASG